MRRPEPSPVASPTAPEGAAIVVFDGVCALCSRWVRFLLRHDHRGHYRFAAMQSPRGSALLREHGLDPADPLSFLLLTRHGALTDSDAAITVVAGLGGVWRSIALLRVLPRRWRDAGYRVLARNRHRWFGTTTQCFLPEPQQRSRFLE
ncbi:thiol-disulfide oxidoreductase DCC family protein [Xanthomonas sp. LMG 8992]|uniref:thiol-disulfide oxidoreductase DCC family protein n=1 Tax=Xanthomonas sp. LMG 8992 TaxID=1591157 RepID=UPI00136B6D05|nr:thiol-disulfide oxidoreductase DCC family protein [Xanthomonas sp. LMG 8992]MXV09870.1 thiol-disulfide oxidoreductase DCC family protein [Xanthomonas sp. LMG 8992]